MDAGLTDLIALVPASWWPVVGHWVQVGMTVMTVCYVVLWALEKIDMRDGKRDLPGWVHAAYEMSVLLVGYTLAILEMALPVRPPIVDGLRRMRALSRGPHVDDRRGSK